ncbi:MAG: HAD-IIIA family hydrolase, partial [Bacteroidetes bacterium]|nr:HAD-IIIA family hydrolase [Bacteroidota bacterium]
MMKIAYLDRDGVINLKARSHQYITSWEQFKFSPNIFNFLRDLIAKGYKLIIVTNQQGIGKNLFTIGNLSEIHENMLHVFSENNIKIEKIYFCPHTKEENCNCRKPS